MKILQTGQFVRLRHLPIDAVFEAGGECYQLWEQFAGNKDLGVRNLYFDRPQLMDYDREVRFLCAKEDYTSGVDVAILEKLGAPVLLLAYELRDSSRDDIYRMSHSQSAILNLTARIVRERQERDEERENAAE